MIELPTLLTDPSFDRQVKKGAIFHWLNAPISNNKTKPKFVMIIGRYIVRYDEVEERKIAYFYTTTVLDKYKIGSRFYGSSVLVPTSTFSYFKKDTMIQCHDLEYFPEDTLRKIFSTGIDFVRIEDLPETIFNNVITTALASRLLSPEEKDIIKNCLKI